jgi:hypothetical protein
MATQPTESFRCGFAQRYASPPLFANGGASWPFVRLHLEEEAFVLGLWRFFPSWGLPSRIRYNAIAEAGLRTAFPPRIRIRLNDPGKGLIRITTLDDGAVKLAGRLKQLGVRVCDEADFGLVGRLND